MYTQNKRIVNDSVYKSTIIMALTLFVLFAGTVFYTYYDDFGWIVGFYYSISIGFCLGFTYGEGETGNSPIFTTFYMIISIVLLDVLIVYMSRMFLIRMNKWYTAPARSLSGKPMTDWEKVYYYMYDQLFGLLVLMLLAVLVTFIGVMVEVFVIGWDVMDSIYFTISLLTAIGVIAVPYDENDYVYLFVALLSLFGVVVYGVLALTAAEILVAESKDVAVAIASQDLVHPDELKVLDRVGWRRDVETRKLTRNEYFVLQVARMGLLNVTEVKQIFDNFDAIDVSKIGTVDIADIGCAELGSHLEDEFNIDDGSTGAVGEAERQPLVAR